MVKDVGSAESRWDRRWAQHRGLRLPARFVVESARYLPGAGRALDVAGGPGWHSLWLAGLGYEVTLVDVSTVALAAARDRAEQLGLELTAVHRDLEVDDLPSGPWAVILIHHFLDRELLAGVPDALAPGGVVVFCQPTDRDRNRSCGGITNPRFLLRDGELARIVADAALDVLVLEEGWSREGRHEARLVARRPKP